MKFEEALKAMREGKIVSHNNMIYYIKNDKVRAKFNDEEISTKEYSYSLDFTEIMREDWELTGKTIYDHEPIVDEVWARDGTRVHILKVGYTSVRFTDESFVPQNMGKDEFARSYTYLGTAVAPIASFFSVTSPRRK